MKIQEKREELQNQIKESEKRILSLTEELFSQMNGAEVTEHLQSLMMSYYNPVFPQNNINDIEDLRLREVADITFANALITKMLSQIGKEWEKIDHFKGQLSGLKTIEKQSA